MGGLIQATLGNAVEIVVALQALYADQIRVVQVGTAGLLVVLEELVVSGEGLLRLVSYGRLDHHSRTILGRSTVRLFHSSLKYSNVLIVVVRHVVPNAFRWSFGNRPFVSLLTTFNASACTGETTIDRPHYLGLCSRTCCWCSDAASSSAGTRSSARSGPSQT